MRVERCDECGELVNVKSGVTVPCPVCGSRIVCPSLPPPPPVVEEPRPEPEPPPQRIPTPGGQAGEMRSEGGVAAGVLVAIIGVCLLVAAGVEEAEVRRRAMQDVRIGSS